MSADKKYIERKLQNKDHQNWLRVGYGLDKVRIELLRYIDREAKAFHQKLMAKGMTPCMCLYVKSRNPKSHHDHCCDWAKELKSHHKKRNPTWKQSDSTKWTDPVAGPWEVAKLFMPIGCAVGSTSPDDTDLTGLLNLLVFCDHYKTNTTEVQRLRAARNGWAHTPKQELTDVEKSNSFTCMKKLLRDKELKSDLDAQSALETLKDIENYIIGF